MRNASEVEEEEDATWKKKEKKAACKIQVTNFLVSSAEIAAFLMDFENMFIHIQK